MVTLLALGASLLVTVVLAVPVVWATFLIARGLGVAERSRVAALLGEEIGDPHPPLTSTSWWRRLLERLASGSRWREIAYLVVRLPVGVFAFVTAVVLWCGSFALLALPLYAGALPGGTAKFGLFEVGSGAGAVGLAAVGLLGVALVAPWTTIGLGAVDRVLARSLLGPRRGHPLEARVSQLDASRAAAVDVAEAERRRIERDLHDGAQARLVNLGMELGRAQQRIETDPEGAKLLIESAHAEAKAALADLRDLVRGMHPAILEDRGLDAALSSVVAGMPVPVTLRVDVAVRPPAAVESTVYFVVTEALTNVARHAGASRATVTIVRAGDRLVLEVTDDGRGGADAAAGTGLAGLRARVSALDGWMQVVSPPGGPTSLFVELPCGS
jgi:signal transduction histidine kinase